MEILEKKVENRGILEKNGFWEFEEREKKSWKF
jgi:hypothetical protein